MPDRTPPAIPLTAISVPTRYIHSNNETISKKDYDASIALTVALLETDLSKVEF